MKKVCCFLIVFISFNSCKKEDKDYVSADDITSILNMIIDNNSDVQNKKYNDSAFFKLKAINNSVEKRKYLDEIANNYYYLNNWNEFKEVSNDLLENSYESKDSVYIGKSLRYLGNFHYKKMKLDSAFYYYSKSEKVFSNLKDKNNLAQVLLKKGIVQFEINDFLGADYTLRKSYGLLKNTTNYQLLYVSLNSLGSVSTELKEFGRAISHYEKALQVIKIGNLQTRENQEANCLNNLGLVYSDVKNYEKAIYYYKKAILNKSIKEENPQLYSIIIDNLAYAKLKIGDQSELPDLFFESLKYREDGNIYNSKIVVYIHLSEYYSIKNDTLKAVKYSKKAIKLSNKSKKSLFKIASLRQASTVDNKNSSKYSDEYIKISDSLQIAERKSKDRFARIQLETDEIIQENDVLADKNRNLLFFLVGSLVIFGFLFYLRNQISKNRELAHKEAQQRTNEEIFNLMLSQQAVIDESRTEEKQKLAQELHDGVLGRMFGIRLSLDSANQRNDDDSKQKRFEIIEQLKTIEQDIREISHDLSSEKEVLINNFVSIVSNLIEEQEKNHQASVSFYMDTTIQWDKISSVTKINLYRVLQESLQNINKYAKANTINIGFLKNSDSLLLKIGDDGVGFDTSKKAKGIGTKNMEARTKQCGGVLNLLSAAGDGTTITATIPIKTITKPKT